MTLRTAYGERPPTQTDVLTQTPKQRRHAEMVAVTEDYIRRWDFAARPRHCANCTHAIVSNEDGLALVSCDAGHGRIQELFRLIRPTRPVGFRDAAKCPDFDRAG